METLETNLLKRERPGDIQKKDQGGRFYSEDFPGLRINHQNCRFLPSRKKTPQTASLENLEKLSRFF